MELIDEEYKLWFIITRYFEKEETSMNNILDIMEKCYYQVINYPELGNTIKLTKKENRIYHQKLVDEFYIDSIRPPYDLVKYKEIKIEIISESFSPSELFERSR